MQDKIDAWGRALERKLEIAATRCAAAWACGVVEASGGRQARPVQ